MTRFPISLPAVPALAVAALVALTPAAADAAKKKRPLPKKPAKLGLTAKSDPLAPQGFTPKVLFSVQNAVKGREYRIMAKQVRGEQARPNSPTDTPLCSPALGGTTTTKALFNGPLAFHRMPFDVDVANEGYDLIAGEPCQGVYESEVEELGRRGRSIEFVLQVPEMTVDVVARYG